MEESFIISELEEYKSKVNALFSTYSEEELLIKYRDSLTNSTSLEKIILFDVLNQKVKDISTRKRLDLYNQANALFSIEEIKNDEVGDILLKKVVSKFPFDEVYTQKMIECMVKLSNLYNEGLITNKDVYTIEGAIDKISIPNLKTSNKIELERIYSKFKEFTMNVYLKEQEEKK